MIKKLWIVQCDFCGKIENAKMVYDSRNDNYPTLPAGWSTGQNKDFHLCPECSGRLNEEVSGEWQETK